ncbi:MAG: serine/threonine-protein kinase, partial [Gaiellales bacterium]
RYPHLLLEYVQGANLREWIEERVTLSVDEVLPVAVDVLALLHYLGVNDVVHLDVKPSNIVLTDPPRLIDLGSARTLEEAAARRTPIGTAAYMAPEQCDPASELGPIGPPADTWGLGVTLYHALTGKRPFSRPAPRGSEPIARYPQLREEPLPIPDYVPEQVASVLMRMLARDPRERPTPTEAAETLEPLVAGAAAV